MRALIFLFLGLAFSAQAQTPAAPAAAKYPPVGVQVTVGTRQRAEPGSYYKKNMTLSPKVTIEGSSRMLPMPAAEATMLIVTMDTRAKYTEKREAYLIHGTETVPIPEAKNGDRRQFEFAESQTSFDAYRDTSNVGGEVYKYYVFGLRDAATKTLIDFKTNNLPLAAFCKEHPERREEFLKGAKGTSFPTTFK